MTFPVRLIWYSRPRRLQQPPNLSGRSFECSTLVVIPPSAICAEISISLSLCGQRYATRTGRRCVAADRHVLAPPLSASGNEPAHWCGWRMNFWIAKECLLVEHSRHRRHILRYNVGRRLVLALVPGSAARCGEGGAIS